MREPAPMIGVLLIAIALFGRFAGELRIAVGLGGLALFGVGIAVALLTPRPRLHRRR